MSNLKCSNEGCTSVLNIDMSEDVKKKRLSKMKACAQCQRTQYCSKECQPLPSFPLPAFSLFFYCFVLPDFCASLCSFFLLVAAGRSERALESGPQV